MGVDRLFLAVICSAYTTDVVDGEVRSVLKFAPSMAPIKASIFPLVNNNPALVEKARALFDRLQRRWNVDWDVSGNIGRRYRRADEIGTPFCITVDYETVEKDDCVTVRYRDTTEQVRIPIDDIDAFLQKEIDGY
jgi:glycyl-tRNA synthetase